jgi:hypothetical protein
MMPQVHETLLEQRKAFKQPGPDDPVFFHPDKDVPTPIDPARLDADLEKAIRDADIDPAKPRCGPKAAWLAAARQNGEHGRASRPWLSSSRRLERLAASGFARCPLPNWHDTLHNEYWD